MAREVEEMEEKYVIRIVLHVEGDEAPIVLEIKKPIRLNTVSFLLSEFFGIDLGEYPEQHKFIMHEQGELVTT